MMTVWRAHWRSLPRRAWHLLLCLVGIIVGTGVFVAALTLASESRATADSVTELLATDISVVPEESLVAPDAAPVPPLVAAEVVAEVAALPGVEEAQGAIITRGVLAVAADGSVMRPQLSPVLAGSLPDPATGPGLVEVVEGRVPAGPNEVVVDATTLSRADVALGEPLGLVRTGPFPGVTAEVVGVVETPAHPGSDASLVFFSEEGARQHLLQGADGYNWIRVATTEDAGHEDLRLPILSIVPGDYEVVDRADVARAVWFDLYPQFAVSFGVLLVAVLVALVVACFVIGTSVSHLVARQRAGIARLRRMGIPETRLRLPVLAEALLIGAAGSALALPVGRWAATALNDAAWEHGLALGGRVTALPGWLAWVAIGVGALVTVVGTQLSMSAPANRSPLQPNRQPSAPRLHFSDASWTSVGMVAVGLALLLVGTIVPGMPFRFGWVVLGGAVLLVGTAIASPVLGTPVVRAIGAALRLLLRDVGTLAARNVERKPGRFGQAGAALVLVSGLLAAFAVLGASGRASAAQDLPSQLPGDVFIQAMEGTTTTPGIDTTAAELPGVAATHSYGRALAMDGSQARQVLITDPASLEALTSLEVTEGRSIQGPDEVLLEEGLARSAGVQRGDGLEWTINLERADLRVVGLFTTERGLELPGVVALRETFTARGYPDNTSMVALAMAPGLSTAEVVSQARELVSADPLLEVATADELATQRGNALAAPGETIASFVGPLLVLSVIGITGVLLVALHERRDEIRALQLAGLDDAAIAAMIALEAVIMGAVAALLGTIAGTLAGWALQAVLTGAGYTTLAIPWGTLLGLVGTGILVGLAGAVVPGGNALLLSSEGMYAGPHTGERHQGAESAGATADPQT